MGIGPEGVASCGVLLRVIHFCTGRSLAFRRGRMNVSTALPPTRIVAGTRSGRGSAGHPVTMLCTSPSTAVDKSGTILGFPIFLDARGGRPVYCLVAPEGALRRSRKSGELAREADLS